MLTPIRFIVWYLSRIVLSLRYRLRVTGLEEKLKKPGPYLRHSLSHGLLHDGDPYGNDAIYACWLIFHLCMLPLFPCRTQLTLPFDDVTEDQPAEASTGVA